ncbi:MAG: NAD(P)-dependent alcohol dehydrogenase [Nevskiales bacterium]
MKAIRYEHFGPPEVLQWVDIPTPQPGPREVLVKVAAAAVNPKDMLMRKGRMKFFTGNRLPRGCGQDFSGTVVSTGSERTALKPGDEVYGMLNGWDACTYAEYTTAPVGDIAPRPGNLPLEEAAGLPLVCQTSLQALRDLGKPRPGMQVLINGASGGVGAHAVQIAKILGGVVTAVCSARNAGMTRELGADETLDYAAQDLLKLDRRFDVFYDVFGNYHFARVGHLLAPRGVYITTVPNPRNLRDHLLSRLLPGRQARLVLVRSNTADLDRLRQWVETGRLRAVIDRRYPMPEAAEAHRYLETRRSRGKILLIPPS